MYTNTIHIHTIIHTAIPVSAAVPWCPDSPWGSYSAPSSLQTAPAGPPLPLPYGRAQSGVRGWLRRYPRDFVRLGSGRPHSDLYMWGYGMCVCV